MGLLNFIRGTRQSIKNAKLGADTVHVLRVYYQLVVDELSVLELANALGEVCCDPHKLAVTYLKKFIPEIIKSEESRLIVERWIELAKYAKSRGAEIYDSDIDELRSAAKARFSLLYHEAESKTRKAEEIRIRQERDKTQREKYEQAEAQYRLGLMCYEGRSVPVNVKEAVQHFRLAADQGHAAAQYDLGLMYATGQGVPENYEKAVRLFRLAAKQGHTAAKEKVAAAKERGY